MANFVYNFSLRWENIQNSRMPFTALLFITSNQRIKFNLLHNHRAFFCFAFVFFLLLKIWKFIETRKFTPQQWSVCIILSETEINIFHTMNNMPCFLHFRTFWFFKCKEIKLLAAIDARECYTYNMILFTIWNSHYKRFMLIC